MGDTDSDKPRHFKAGTSFYLDVAFDSPLPAEAIPNAFLRGPLEGPSPGSQDIATSSSSMRMPDGKIRISGNIPPDVPAGTYKVTSMRMDWAAGAPTSWRPVPIDFSHLDEDKTIIVDAPDHPPQPALPKLTDLD